MEEVPGSAAHLRREAEVERFHRRGKGFPPQHAAALRVLVGECLTDCLERVREDAPCQQQDPSQ